MLCNLSINCMTGWEGAGLGATKQGIQKPVKGGDIRGDVDKYKVRTYI